MFKITILSDSDSFTLQKVLDSYNSHLSIDHNTDIYSYARNEDEIKSVLRKVYYEKSLLVYAISNEEHRTLIHNFCKKHHLKSVNMYKDYIKHVGEHFEFSEYEQRLDEEYYNRVECIEFAIDADDGKSYRRILESDIVILGISRTGKTPLSMILALKGYKVCNIPLFENMTIPKQLYEIERKRIFGLINSVDNLTQIRKNRVKGHNSLYTDDNSIIKELNFAFSLYAQLGCDIINTDNQAVEEIAHYIENIVKEKR